MNLDFQSPWVDEIYTLFDANPNLTISELFLNITTSEVHPPIYFFLIHVWFKIFGFSFDLLRFFSAFFSVICLSLVFILTKLLFNIRAAKIALLFLSANSCFYEFSQEGRSYTFFLCFQTLSIIMLILYHKSKQYIFIILLTVSNIIQLYTSYFGLFSIASQGLIVLLWYIISREKLALWHLVISYTFVALSFVPWLPFTSSRYRTTDLWIQVKPLSELLLFALNFLLPHLYLKVCLVAGLLISAVSSLFRKQFELIILMAWPFFFISLAYLFSVYVTPIITWKYFVFILIPLIILVSYGFSVLHWWWLRYPLLLLFVGFSSQATFWKYSQNYRVTKSEFYSLMNFTSNTMPELPMLAREVKHVEWFNNFNNFNLDIVSVDSMLKYKIMANSSLKNGWWELHTHRPFLTDSLVSRISIIDSFCHFNYSNFSSLDLWVPASKVLPIIQKNTDSERIKYTFENGKAQKVCLIFSIASGLSYYDDSRIEVKLNKQSKSYRLQYQNGIYSCNFYAPAEKFEIEFRNADKRKSVMDKVNLTGLVCIRSLDNME